MLSKFSSLFILTHCELELQGAGNSHTSVRHPHHICGIPSDILLVIENLGTILGFFVLPIYLNRQLKMSLPFMGVFWFKKKPIEYGNLGDVYISHLTDLYGNK